MERHRIAVEWVPRGGARVALAVRDDAVELPADFEQRGAELSMRQDNGSVCELVFDRPHGPAKEGQP